MANPVTALGSNFLTAPVAFAELIKLGLKSLISSGCFCRANQTFQTINTLRKMFRVVLQTCCVKLCQCQQIYHRLSGMCSALESAIKTTPEFNVLRREIWLQNIILTIVVVQRIDEFIC